MLWRVSVSEVIDVRAWIKDDENEYEHKHSKNHYHNVEADTPEDALAKVKKMYEGRNWYLISTNDKVEDNIYQSHCKWNDALWDEAYEKYC